MRVRGQSYPAVGWLINTLVLLVTVDTVIPEDSHTGLWLLAALYVMNGFVEVVVQELCHGLGLGGKARAHLRTSVLNSNLQLTMDAQQQFPWSEVVDLMGHGLAKTVELVWLNLFELWQNLLVVLTMMCIIIFTVRKQAWLVAFPIVMLAFDLVVFYCRAPQQALLYQAFHEESREWRDLTAESTELRNCITSHRMGGQVCQQFNRIHSQSDETGGVEESYNLRTCWIVKWFHKALAAVVFVVATHEAIDNNMKYGDFVVLIMTIFNFDYQVLSLFGSVMQMVNGYAVIKSVAAMLNAPTRRKALLQQREDRVKSLAEHQAAHSDFDEDQIVFAGVEHAYTQVNEEGPAMGPIWLVIDQGGMIAVSAEHGVGKATLLKLLGKILIPTKGFLWYPEDLRVRYVTDQPAIFDKTVLENLRFGNQKEIEEEHIWGLCEDLGVGHLQQKYGDRTVGIHGERLSNSDRVMISLARALLSSVDVLLLSNTLDVLSKESRDRVIGVLKSMIDNRGLGYECDDELDFNARKRKTVIFTTSIPEIEVMGHATVRLFETLEDAPTADDLTENTDLLSKDTPSEAGVTPNLIMGEAGPPPDDKLELPLPSIQESISKEEKRARLDDLRKLRSAGEIDEVEYKRRKQQLRAISSDPEKSGQSTQRTDVTNNV